MVTTKKFKIVDMHCTSCAVTIDMELEDTDGVIESNTSYAKACVEVAFDPKKIQEEDIIAVLKKVGYTAKQTDLYGRN